MTLDNLAYLVGYYLPRRVQKWVVIAAASRATVIHSDKTPEEINILDLTRTFR